MTSKLILFIIFSTSIYHNVSARKLVFKTNHIFKINEMSQRVINNIFALFKLNNSFKESHKVKTLLAVHYQLRNVSENTIEVYERLNKIEIKLRRINRIIYDVIDNIHDKDMYGIKVKELMPFIINVTLEKVLTDPLSDIIVFIGKIIDNVIANSQDIDEGIEGEINDVDAVMAALILQHFFDNTTHETGILTRDNYKSLKEDESVNAYRSLDFDLESWNYKDKVPTNTRRIFQGQPSSISEYPFMASIHIKGQFSCSGSVINKRLIITAATCLQAVYNTRQKNSGRKWVTVRIGSDFANSSGQLIKIAAINIHPEYDPIYLRHNLALLTLTSFRLQRNLNIQRIQIDKSGKVQGNVTILGWGAKDENMEDFKQVPLSISTLQTVKTRKCKWFYGKYITGRHFCAGIEFKGSGACYRDVGGPAIQDNTLIGVISFGPAECGQVDAPTAFTKVAAYGQWIDNVTREINVKPKLRTKPTNFFLTSLKIKRNILKLFGR